MKHQHNFKRQLFHLKDTFRALYPNILYFLRYFSRGGKDGATRIDRSYTNGNMVLMEASYILLEFSNHMEYPTWS